MPFLRLLVLLYSAIKSLCLVSPDISPTHLPKARFIRDCMKPAHIPPSSTLSADTISTTTNMFLIKTGFASSLFLTSHHSSQDKVIAFLQVSFLQQPGEGPATTGETPEVTQIAEAPAYLPSRLPPWLPRRSGFTLSKPSSPRLELCQCAPCFRQKQLSQHERFF